MRSIKTMILSVITMVLCACGQQAAKASEPTGAQEPSQQDRKVLVTYVSFTGTTESVANKLASLLNADNVKLEPETPYTSADLDWNNRDSRCNKEHNDPSMRPALKTTIDNLKDYDVIYLGYPIWWNLAPQIIKTFLDNNDLSGKKVVPFVTSGGSSIDNSATDLKNAYPNVLWQTGKRLRTSTSEDEILKWAEEVK